MIEYFPLRAYLCQIPLKDVIEDGRSFTVESTIEMYMDRSEGCAYKLSNYIYQNNLCAVYDDYSMTILVSLNDNTIWIDRYRMTDGPKITNADKWLNSVVKMGYDKFLAVSKIQCKEMLNGPKGNEIRKIAESTEMKSVDELCRVTESAIIHDLFEYSPAIEAPEDDIAAGLNSLDKISGNKSGGGSSAQEDEGTPVANDGKATDITQATQNQLDEDNGDNADDDFLASNDPFGDNSSDNPFSDSGSDTESNDDDSGEDNGEDKDAKNIENDPMKSVEVKRSYRDRFVKLYEIIEDALTTMESFSPDYNTKSSSKYYTIQMDLNHLKEAIYRICTRRLNKMSVPEVLRAYTIANNIFDISTRMMKEFFDEYNGEVDKMNKIKGNSSK